MMGHKIWFYGEILLITGIPKLSITLSYLELCKCLLFREITVISLGVPIFRIFRLVGSQYCITVQCIKTLKFKFCYQGGVIGCGFCK